MTKQGIVELISGIKYSFDTTSQKEKADVSRKDIVIETPATALAWMDLVSSVFAHCQLNHCPERAVNIIQRAERVADGVIKASNIHGSDDRSVSSLVRNNLIRAILKVPSLSDEVLGAQSEQETIDMMSNVLNYSIGLSLDKRYDGAWIGDVNADDIHLNRAVLLLDRLSSFRAIEEGFKNKIRDMENGFLSFYKDEAKKEGVQNVDALAVEKTRRAMQFVEKNELIKKGVFIRGDFIDSLSMKAMLLSMALTDAIIEKAENDVMDQSSEMIFQSSMKSVTSMLLSAAQDVSVGRVYAFVNTKEGVAEFKKKHGLMIPMMFEGLQPTIDMFTSTLDLKAVDVREVTDNTAMHDEHKEFQAPKAS